MRASLGLSLAVGIALLLQSCATLETGPLALTYNKLVAAVGRPPEQMTQDEINGEISKMTSPADGDIWVKYVGEKGNDPSVSPWVYYFAFHRDGSFAYESASSRKTYSGWPEGSVVHHGKDGAADSISIPSDSGEDQSPTGLKIKAVLFGKANT